jgi:hypothetical protein
MPGRIPGLACELTGGWRRLVQGLSAASDSRSTIAGSTAIAERLSGDPANGTGATALSHVYLTFPLRHISRSDLKSLNLPLPLRDRRLFQRNDIGLTSSDRRIGKGTGRGVSGSTARR